MNAVTGTAGAATGLSGLPTSDLELGAEMGLALLAGSLATGLIAALLLIAAPFISPEENGVTGALLCGFAVGWAMLAILSTRYTDQPQRWAAGPALFGAWAVFS